MKVLVVDDDPIIQMTLESNLQKWDYQPIVAETAELGWDILQNADAPKLAIIDWRLPTMNGIELCKLIKSQEHSFCYIIMLTGRMSSDDVVVGLESGADDYIVKPVDAAELKARLMAGKRILAKIDNLSSVKPRSSGLKSATAVNYSTENNFAAPKILIAEDDPVSREVLMENLTRWGFSVIVTENGQQAVDAFKEHKAPLLGIIDWMMPELSGIEVCKKIKELAESGLCYLILLTAKSQREDIVQGLESGADDYLSKPFHSAELRARINAGIRIINANRHLKAIISNSSEGIMTFDSEGLIDSFNTAAEKMFGFKTHEVLGKNILSLLKEDEDKEKIGDLLATTPDVSVPQALELQGLKKNGACFPLEVNVTQMNYDGNKQFVGIARDISERKRHEKILIEAKEVAENANRAKSQFLSNMSHELRTPLNAILGFAQLLESDTNSPLTPDQQESLDYILQGGNHLLRLINEILDLAKIESGKVTFDYTTVNLDDLLWECISMINQLALNHEVSIAHTETTTEKLVKADQHRLKQVLLNLLSNAVKYNSHPGEVFIEKSQTDTGMLKISITDTGKGIPKDKQKELFQSFSRLGAETTQIEGTGIGLLITKTLIEEMGGVIGFESEVDKGSTFWIQLPIVETDTVTD